MLSYFKIFRNPSEADVKTPFSYIKKFDSTVKKPHFINFDKDTFLSENLSSLNEAKMPEGLWELQIAFEIEPRDDLATGKGLIVSWKYGLEITVNGIVANDRPSMLSSGDTRQVVVWSVIVPMLNDTNLLGIKLDISGYRHSGTSINTLPSGKIQLYNLCLEGKKLYSYTANDTKTFSADESESIETIEKKIKNI